MSSPMASFSRTVHLLVAVAVILSSIFSEVSAEIVNSKVQRVVDASTSMVRVSIDITVEGLTQNEYQIIFPTVQAENLAILTVTLQDNEEDLLTVQPPVLIGDGNFTMYAVELPSSQQSSVSLKALAVLTNVLEPFPVEISQRESQYVRLHDSHYFCSPYRTESQKTSFKLGSASIESFTKLSPFSTRGSSLQFGPFKDVPPLSLSPLTVHYMNNFPFAKFSTMTRELEVSHWGSIAVEEIYELRHAGAQLKGGFSRIDYQMQRGSPSPSFRSLVASLPAQATNIYYRDQIGNISTSDIRFDRDEGVLDLEIQTRFPIFGGWKTQFYLGYTLPTEMALFTDTDGRYNLEFDFFTPFSGVWVEQMELKVVLPEGAEDIKVRVPYPVQHSTARRFTFLDSELNGGRPVLIIRGSNLVEEHDEQVHISYSFARSRMVVEPMMLVGSYFCFFLLCIVLARTSSISSKKTTSSQE